MFSKPTSDVVAPSFDGIGSLVERGVVSPKIGDRMRSAAVLRQKLPPHYRMAGIYDGVPPTVWIEIEAQWDGQVLDGDPTAELAQAVAPLQVQYQGFRDGDFYWVVEAPPPEEPEQQDKTRGRRKAGDE